MAKKAKSEVHVRLETPLELRKTILKTAINSAEILENFELFKRLREEKHKTEAQLIKTLRSIKSRIVSIKKTLPETEKYTEQEIHPEIKIVTPKQVLKQPMKTKKIKPIHVTEADKIKRELHNIESKLASLKL